MKNTITYKGITISSELKKYSEHEDKLFVSFTISGSNYNNATLLPVTADVTRHEKAQSELVKWAKTVIKENS